ncbi:acyltransferase [Oceanicoccus sagamiensis]|uniref:Galactoside O-acetyltransferase n=1 Tax=Oceanicoccus sagamiensis TaxID=716816 RepID=A0A1X9N705_9GAMM|nr:acyltransferase [Oceanicoccus sagamiensis]ARN73880.1 galactoside O-acetyltransferase [Oceanicoccus sagamiensis]
MACLSPDEVKKIGFRCVGDNPRISDKASFYNPGNISLGNNVRIDDFCVFSAGEGGIILGDYIHVAVFSSFIGRGKIALSDFCNISSRVSVYSSNDDYSGQSMTNPTIPEAFTAVDHADVYFEKHVIVGCGSVVLPGITLREGCAIGALSLVSADCDAFSIYAGNPIKRIKSRSRDLLSIEDEFLKSK